MEAQNFYLHNLRHLPQRFGGYDSYAERCKLVHRYAWAIPSKEAIDAIADFTPKVLSIGAGTGYWELLMAQRGLGVVAYDDKSWDRLYRRWSWYPVHRGTHSQARKLCYQHHALFLCWPYMDRMAYRALTRYRGNKLIYIGEPNSGCTANSDFFRILDRDWTIQDCIVLPKWSGIHDNLYLFTKENHNDSRTTSTA